MAWEMRDGSGSYYLRARKVAGRVVKTYFGSGPIAELAARQDAERRQRRLLEDLARREKLERLRQADRLVGSLDEVGRVFVTARLNSAGLFQHARGVWRRRSGRSQLAHC